MKIYVAIGPNEWGKGFSIDEAVRGARSYWYSTAPFRKAKLNIYECEDPEAYVDDMGTLWSKAGTLVTLIQESSLVKINKRKNGLADASSM